MPKTFLLDKPQANGTDYYICRGCRATKQNADDICARGKLRHGKLSVTIYHNINCPAEDLDKLRSIYETKGLDVKIRYTPYHEPYVVSQKRRRH